VGNWLYVFREHGVEEILGIDGDYVDTKLLKIPQDCFLPHNLTKPLKVEQYFDLVVSVEVAEHLPIENAEEFVDTLVRLGPVILFSAAIPHQPGDSHLNTQWPDYWANLFQQREYTVIDCLRNKFWQNENVHWWYSQNMFLFVKQTELEKFPLLKQEYSKEEFSKGNVAPLSLVHPDLYLKQQAVYQSLKENYDPTKMSVKDAWLIFWVALENSLKRKLSQTRS
jgi:hypothetical protein